MSERPSQAEIDEATSSHAQELEEKMAETVTSYGDGFERVMRDTGMSADDLREKMLDNNIEQCPNCKWWTESHNLLCDDSEDPDGFCDNCRNYDKAKPN